MCLDRQGSLFEGDDHVPFEETKEANWSTSPATSDSGDNGRPTAKEESLQNEGTGKRLCDSCGRIFSSGKALGGHKAKGKCSDTIRKGCDLTTGKGKHICGVCGKDFPSVMSLSGHMRAHPERDWRGIQPPPPSHRTSISISTMSDSVDQKVDDHNSLSLACKGSDIDLLKSLAHWSNTDKRGRESSSRAVAAQSLVCLSRGSKSLTPNPSLTVNDKSLANKATIESKKYGFSVSYIKRSIDRSLFKKRGLKRLEFCRRGSLKVRNKTDETGEDEQKLMEEQSQSKKTNGAILVKTQMKKKKGKGWKLMMVRRTEPEETLVCKTQMVPDGYICSSCGRSFKTFQALGGHRSIHTNDKKRQSTDSSFADASVEKTKESNATSPVGQAPDGHIRCNWRVEVEAPSSEVESPGEASQSAPKIELPVKASQTVRRILDFDLNEPYLMED